MRKYTIHVYTIKFNQITGSVYNKQHYGTVSTVPAALEAFYYDRKIQAIRAKIQPVYSWRAIESAQLYSLFIQQTLC